MTDKSLTPCAHCEQGYEVKDMHRTHIGFLCKECADALADEYWEAVAEERRG